MQSQTLGTTGAVVVFSNGRVRTGQVVGGNHGAREVVLALVVLLPGDESNYVRVRLNLN